MQLAAGSAIPFATFLITAVLMAALGYPLRQRKVKQNYLYGFRTPATLKDEALWYDVNEKAGKDLISIGLVLGVLTLALFGWGVELRVATGACVTWLLAGTTLSFGRGLMMIQQRKRLARKNGLP